VTYIRLVHNHGSGPIEPLASYAPGLSHLLGVYRPIYFDVILLLLAQFKIIVL